MKEESLLGKLGTRSTGSSARYRELERLGEVFRGKKQIVFIYLIIYL